MSFLVAELKDGRKVEYHAEPAGEGSMKRVHLTRDGRSVVCFYRNGSDQQRMARLEAIVGRMNVTRSADYWKHVFCWPTDIVTSPSLGVLAPAYPDNFRFASGHLKGREKDGSWFTLPRARRMVPPEERGDWEKFLRACILLARGVRRLHQAGLAHSDLSNRNVLIDPVGGQAVVIDIDSLVVPQIFPPEVLGTRRYMAPEVLATSALAVDDPQRRHPSAMTDQHALAVLVYEFLLQRHPLNGPRTFPCESGEEQERLEMGERALYVEHPTDRSNRPADLKVEAKDLGPALEAYFREAFVTGLHVPEHRPAAIALEAALLRTYDMLHPCGNAACEAKWFVLHDRARCPFCGQGPRPAGGYIPVLTLRSSTTCRRLVVSEGQGIYGWHARGNLHAAEDADRTRQAWCTFHQGQWLMINEKLPTLMSPGGSPVPPGHAVALHEGARFRLSQEADGLTAEVSACRV